MSWMEMPDGTRHEIFGAGGGQSVADSLTRDVGAPVPLLGQIPLDTRLREGADNGMPVVLGEPNSPSAVVLRAIARSLSTRSRGLAGRSLGLTPAGR
jgi:ATP-binding protein involved in chromosome partitioning